MADPTTANVQLAQPTRGSDVGVWDVPVNNNTLLLDYMLGAVATISLNNANVTLSSSQYQSKTITFNSTLTGSVIITFPTSFIKSYEIYNLCTGSSAFTITLQTSAGGQIVCAPPGESVDIWNDGSNLRYKNLGRVGSYWDYAGSSVPAWVSGCTVPPYLNCDGTTFSAATYPALAIILGSTTLPDSKGRARYALDQGAGRVSSAVSGVAGNTIFTGGGDQRLHNHIHAATDSGHTHQFNLNNSAGGNPIATGSISGNLGNQTVTTGFANITVANSTLGGGSQNMPPIFVSGLMLMRAG